MLWWGSKGKFINLGPMGARQCGVCEKSRNFSLILSYKVHHIWYLLRWITSKSYAITCDICNHATAADPLEIEAAAEKHPVPWFDRFGWAMGLGVVGVLIAIAVVGDKHNQAEDAGFIAAPHVGDLYKVDFARMIDNPEASVMYSAMRIMAVKGDQVTFQLSNDYYNKQKGVDRDFRDHKVDDAAYYGEEPITLAVAEIRKFREEGAIKDIERR
jgi:hypothetical protein